MYTGAGPMTIRRVAPAGDAALRRPRRGRIVLRRLSRLSAAAAACLGLPFSLVSPFHPSNPFEEPIMGKYVVAWILGVPAVVLAAIYLFMH